MSSRTPLKKSSPVHVAPACTGSEEWSDHFGSYIRKFPLHFCKRLLQGLELITSWSRGNSFTAAPLFIKTTSIVINIKSRTPLQRQKQETNMSSRTIKRKTSPELSVDGSRSGNKTFSDKEVIRHSLLRNKLESTGILMSNLKEVVRTH
jgi:hypothetical protein